MMEERYLRLEEVVDLMGASEASIYRWVKNKTFPAPHKFGKSSRWLLSEIKEYGQSTIPADCPNSQPTSASCAAVHL